MFKLFTEVQEIITEVQNSKVVIESISSLVEEVSKAYSAQIETFLVSILKHETFHTLYPRVS